MSDETALRTESKVAQMAHVAAYAESRRAIGNLHLAHLLQKDVLEWVLAAPGANPLDVVHAHGNLAATLSALGDLAAAREHQVRALEVSREHVGRGHDAALTAANNLAATLCTLGEYAEAASLQEEVCEHRYRRALVPDAPALVSALNLAATYQAAGRLTEAAELQRTVVAQCREHLGNDHPTTLAAANNLACTLYAMGELTEAYAVAEVVVADSRRTLGADHPHTLESRANLATIEAAQGRLAEAQAIQEELSESLAGVLTPRHASTLANDNNLACTYAAQGRFPEARQRLAALRERLSQRADAQPIALTVELNWAATAEEADRAEAVRVLRAEARRPKAGGDTPAARVNLANLLTDSPAEADELLNQVLGASDHLVGAHHPARLAARHARADLRRRCGREDAMLLHTEVCAAYAGRLGRRHPATLAARLDVAHAHQERREFDAARQVYDDVVATSVDYLGADNPFTRAATAESQLAAAEQLRVVRGWAEHAGPAPTPAVREDVLPVLVSEPEPEPEPGLEPGAEPEPRLDFNVLPFPSPEPEYPAIHLNVYRVDGDVEDPDASARSAI